MADQNTHINYSAEDIERYLKGKMSAKEMHDMEKAALQDPFLADAIEGYSNASFEESQKYLNEINAGLQTQKEETKVVALSPKNFYWWRVAAIFILVVGVGAISWFIITSNNKMKEVKELAKAKENKILNTDTLHEKETASVIIKSDTSKELLAQNISPKSLRKENKKDLQKKNVAALRQQPSVVEAFKKRVPDSLALDTNITAGITPSKIITEDSLQVRAQTPLAFEKSKSVLSNKILNTFNGRVVDNNNQPVGYATLIVNNKQSIITDTNGYFKLQSPDSLLNVNISSVGFVATNTQLKSDVTNKIVIRPNRLALDEVVTAGFGKRKEDKRTTIDSAYPAGGWESFQAYVYKKLKKPFDSTFSTGISGDVELEFSIDENGDPYNFSVIKSVNDTSASEAIEIVKDGPKWIATNKKKKGKVTIRF